MPELTTRPRTRETPGGLPDPLDPFGDGAADASAATVSSGMYTEQVATDGATVSELRRRLADRLDIDPNARAVIDGDIVGDENTTTLRAGQLLTFVRHAGEKGYGPIFLDDAIDRDAVMVGSGACTERVAASGATVADLRRRLADRLQIDTRADAILDGEPVRDERATALSGGQTLTFIRRSGGTG